MTNSKEGSVGIIILILILAGATGFIFGSKKFMQKEEPKQEEEQVLNAEKKVEDTKTSTTQEVKDETSGWKTYINTQYGFELKYPFGLVVGRASANSTLGTYEDLVPGIYLGSYVLVPGKGRANFYDLYDQSYNTEEEATKSFETAEGPWAACYKSNVPNTNVTIKTVHCMGEGGAAYYGLIEKGDKHIYIDGYSKGWAGSYNQTAPEGPKTQEELNKILGTVKFTY